MTDNSRSFAISTFGCKVNQYESQVIRERLLLAGGREDVVSPHLVVINSCAVTARAEAKVRKEIRHWLRRSPESRFILVGCGLTYSEFQNRSLWEIVPPARRGELPEDISRDGPCMTTFSADHSRAFVKIQDGCDSFCSYCIIPYLRGKPVSRPPEEIVREVSGLVRNGYREIVLTGINMGKYGKDLTGDQVNLVILLKYILKLKESFRIRLSSIEPREISSSLIRLIADEEGICPHIHIPLQSGSDEVLREMNRKYTSGEYIEIIQSLRAASPDISISTDCLVGFPGEDDDDFQASANLIREIGFSKVHIFPYSRRDGTAASRYPGLDQKLISSRVNILKSISQTGELDYRKRFMGKIVEIIIESQSCDGIYSGLDRHYNRVLASGANCQVGQICRVKVIGADSDGLRGKVEQPYSNGESPCSRGC